MTAWSRPAWELGIGDVNLDGRLDIFKTHFADDTHVLYVNDGQGMFRDITLKAGIGRRNAPRRLGHRHLRLRSRRAARHLHRHRLRVP